MFIKHRVGVSCLLGRIGPIAMVTSYYKMHCLRGVDDVGPGAHPTKNLKIKIILTFSYLH